MIDPFKWVGTVLVVSIIVCFVLMVILAFPVHADTSGRVKEHYLSDHTRCAVVYDGAVPVAMSCDWERKYDCGQRP